MTADDKYVVFKREDWEKFSEAYGHEDIGLLASQTLQDAVVIRTSDVYAGPALHAYAAMVSMISKTLREIVPDLADRQQRVADYFHDRATEADEHPRPKYPD